MIRKKSVQWPMESTEEKEQWRWPSYAFVRHPTNTYQYQPSPIPPIHITYNIEKFDSNQTCGIFFEKPLKTAKTIYEEPLNISKTAKNQAVEFLWIYHG